MSRTKKSFINILFAVIYQVLIILINFVTRTLLFDVMGKGYVGIVSLFTSILAVLSLTDMGIGVAMQYSMYKPLAEDDHKKLSALIQYFKKIYNMIAGGVFLLGCLLLPFLNFFVELEEPIPYLEFYFFLFLCETVSTYLCVYKTTIFTADQKAYKVKIYQGCFMIVRFVLQVMALVLWGNFLFYILSQIVTNILFNIYASKSAERHYSYIKEKEELDKEEKTGIWSNVKLMFAYKSGGVVLNNTDSILISKLLSTEIVGLFANYTMIITAITQMLSSIFIAIQSSVGNLNVEGNEEEQYKVFKLLDFMAFILYGFCSVCFCTMLQGVVEIWMGKDNLLDPTVIYVYMGTFYLTGILYPIWEYRETIGLFKHTSFIMYIAAVINLVLSIVLGKMWGLQGILLATVIARLATNTWFEAYKLHQIYFHRSVKGYYFEQVKRIVLLIATVVLIEWIMSGIPVENIWGILGIRFAVTTILMALIIFIYSFKREEFLYILNMVKKNLKKIK